MATATRTRQEQETTPPETSMTETVGTAVPSHTANHVVLGARDVLTGKLTIEGSLEVHGTVEGELQATGNVEISRTANVTATVEGKDVTVQGTVHGNVTAKGKLVVNGSGNLTGDVRVAKLQIDDGATVNGSITMGSSWPKSTEE